MNRTTTARGFRLFTFKDANGAGCSLQKSSAATENKVWLGVTSADPQILASQAAQHGVQTAETVGWVPYPIPDAVFLTTRMHLSRQQVAELLPALQHFVATGELP